ncbi:AMP-binding protein [Piscinibacter sp.]|jgi:long-chain acyl-CoA synthetase|uniref:AMP-binding protein n=1 Tax=Piscinibacter sp. TaxID=1903157 RepID=UPI003559EB84
MDKVWLTNYPPGMPAEVDVNAYASLKEVVEQSCRRFSELIAYSNMGVTMTYRELDEASREFAAYLQKSLGLRNGDRVAIMMPNLLQYPVALFGVLRAGLVVVNVNPQYTASELEHQLKDSGAGVIVVLENFAHTLQEVLERNPTLHMTVITTEVGDMFPVVKELVTNVVVKYVKKMVPQWHIAQVTEFNAALRAGRSQTLDDAALTHDDVAFLQYTGGTTGVAKGAILTHGNLVANVQQLSAWIARDLQDGKETLITPLPLYHVFALTSTLVFMKIGAHNVLITNPRDLPAFIHELKRTRFTAMIGVNTLFNALLNTPEFAQVEVHGLKLACAGGMAVQRAVAEKWKQVTGVPIVEAYGLTETSPAATANALDIKDWTGTIGMPIPSTEAAVLDDDDKELPIGEVGEICIRGPQVMRGYWNRPDETQKVFTSDGWFRTGDMGFMDERGYFKITDRKKDMIIVSGFKVFPNQIEDVVMLHAGVLEVAAVGAVDPKSGEIVRIVVVKRDATLTEEILIEHCKKHLTGYKIPKIVEFRTEPLPKSNIGKILRRQLREAPRADSNAAAAPATAHA